MVVIKGFGSQQGLAEVQASAEQCCQDIAGIQFVLGTYSRGASPAESEAGRKTHAGPIAILSLTSAASWALMARVAQRATTGTALEFEDISLPAAG